NGPKLQIWTSERTERGHVAGVRTCQDAASGGAAAFLVVDTVPREGGFRDRAPAVGPRPASDLSASGASGLAPGRSLEVFLNLFGGALHDVDGAADHIARALLSLRPR
ncbi:MAG: hypothetical protein OXC53_09300, partial [Rhodobacteraceae bacterium]|nr:hypothetical protein [Paracoccaceae bacterium]